jgi:flavin-dependent dehydrogenase
VPAGTLPGGSFDVAIAGGGPAGSAAAMVLARNGLRVLLADASGDREIRMGESLPPSASSLLRELGVLQCVRADGHRESPGTLAFWGGDGGNATDFLFQLHGSGWQLDRARFDARLRAAARAAGAEFVGSSHLRLESAAARADVPHRLRARRDGVDGPVVTARWLIDASGRAASLARHLGAVRLRHDNLLAFQLRLHSPSGDDRDGRTWVEAVEDGWWYSVLPPGGERIAVFLTDADLADTRALLDAEGIWSRLRRTTQLRALCERHAYRHHGRARGADAASAELDRAAGHRWLAVGDAALAFDPLSSKGIGDALYTGIQAAKTIIAREAGDEQAPDRYADHLRDIHRVYRAQLHAFYAMQARWSESPFWRRRATRGR